MAIPKDLREVIEDSDDDYPLFFAEPDQLLEIFSTLEEQNLFLIQQSQEIEQQYEQKKHEYLMLEQDLNREILLLNKGLSEVEDKKGRLQQESKVMQSSAADEEIKKIDPKDYKEINELIAELYNSSGTGERGGNPKMGNAGVI